MFYHQHQHLHVFLCKLYMFLGAHVPVYTHTHTYTSMTRPEVDVRYLSLLLSTLLSHLNSSIQLSKLDRELQESACLHPQGWDYIYMLCYFTWMPGAQNSGSHVFPSNVSYLPLIWYSKLNI